MSDQLKQMASLLAQNPGLLDQLNDLAGKNTKETPPAREEQEGPVHPTPDQFMKAAAKAMKSTFEENAPGLSGRNVAPPPEPAAEGGPATEPEEDVPTAPPAKKPVEEEVEEEEEMETDEENESTDETAVEEEEKDDEEETVLFPKKLAEKYKQTEVQLKKQFEEKQKEFQALQANLKDYEKAFSILHNSTNAKEMAEKAEKLREKKVRAAQEKMSKSLKYAEKILKDEQNRLAKQEGDSNFENLEEIEATKGFLEAMRQAATEEDVVKAQQWLKEAEPYRVLATAAARRISQSNGRLSDMERQLQASKKKNASRRKGKRSASDDVDFPSPSDLGGKKTRKNQEFKDEDEERIEQLAVELRTFAASTYHVWSDKPEPRHQRIRKPFCRRDFGKMVPFSESIEPEYALQAADQFHYRNHGCPNTRSVLSSLFGGTSLGEGPVRSGAVQEIDEKTAIFDVPRPDLAMGSGGYSDEQAKAFGLMSSD